MDVVATCQVVNNMLSAFKAHAEKIYAERRDKSTVPEQLENGSD